MHNAKLSLVSHGMYTADSLHFEIIGEACVPEIMLLEPVCTQIDPVIKFPLTLVKSSSNQKLVIKNSGLLKCTVELEICFDELDQLQLVLMDQAVDYLHVNCPEGKFNRNLFFFFFGL